jgi:hypothetical protein
MASKGRNLRPENIVTALLERLVWLTFPPSKRRKLEGVVVTHIERVPVLTIWGRWEQTFKPKGSKSKLTVPGIEPIWDAFHRRFPEAEAATYRFYDLMGYQRQGRLPTDDSLAKFELLGDPEQEEAVALARTIHAFEAARIIIRAEQIAVIEAANTGSPVDFLKDELDVRRRRRLRELRGDMERQQEGYGAAARFIHTVQWERAAIQVTEEVLPEGPWPRQPELLPALAVEPVLPPEAVLEIGEVLVVQPGDPRIDPERDKFYTDPIELGGLGCQRRVVLGHFSKKGYVLYLWRAPSRCLYAILDSPIRGNAGLIFLIGVPGPDEEPTAWQAALVSSKHELFLARQAGIGPCLKAFYHSKLWQDNLRKYMAKLA